MLKDLLAGSISQHKLFNNYNATLINTTLPNYVNAIVIKPYNHVEIFVNKSVNNFNHEQIIQSVISKIKKWKCNNTDRLIDFIFI